MENQIYRISDFCRTRLPLYNDTDPVYASNCPPTEHYLVSTDENGLLVKIQQEIDHTYECELDVDSGKFIGIDHGEFGGGLFFVPKEIATRLDEIEGFSHDSKMFSLSAIGAECIIYEEQPYWFSNVSSIFRHGDRILYLAGLAHMGTDEGALMEVVTQDGKFVSKLICDLDSCPRVYHICHNKIYIAANSKFVVFDLSRDTVYLKMDTSGFIVCTSKTEKSSSWQSLNSTSVAVLNDANVYIGFNGGIQKLDLYHETESFYVRKEYKNKKVTILFPSDYFDHKKVDETFLPEYETVCKIPEFHAVLYNHDAYINEGPPVLREYPVFEPGLCIARTWMLSWEQYRPLYLWLDNCGSKMVNTVPEYMRFHHFPQIYPLLTDFTPRIIRYPSRAEIDAEVVSAVFDRFMIKDDVKSVSGYDFPEFFETPIDHGELLKHVNKFIELRDNHYSGSIVFKEYVDLKRYEAATNEYRVFYFMGEVLSVSKNSNQPVTCPRVPDSLVQKFRSLPSQYYTIDFGELESGVFVIIETGDGQVSGLPHDQDISKYYDSMRNILKEKGLI